MRAARNHQHGFLYSGGTFTTLDDPLGTGTSAYGINNAGQIVGAYTDANKKTHGFLYSGGAFTPLDDPLATGITQAFGINDAGQIVGEYVSGAALHGFLYGPNRGVFPPYFTIDPPSANVTIAYGINNAGQIVGAYTDANNKGHGFLYSGGLMPTFTTLDDPLGLGTGARGINDTGQIVGGYSNEHGFLYSGGFYTTLDDPLATVITEAFGINDAGQIVGTYIDASGDHGFLEIAVPNPPPPPGTTADMILRASNTSPIAGQYEIYDIGNNAISAAYSLGQIGTDWPSSRSAAFSAADYTNFARKFRRYLGHAPGSFPAVGTVPKNRWENPGSR